MKRFTLEHNDCQTSSHQNVTTNVTGNCCSTTKEDVGGIPSTFNILERHTENNALPSDIAPSDTCKVDFFLQHIQKRYDLITMDSDSKTPYNIQ